MKTSMVLALAVALLAVLLVLAVHYFALAVGGAVATIPAY